MLEKGSTPSRENAKACRDAATTYTGINVKSRSEYIVSTKLNPIIYLAANELYVNRREAESDILCNHYERPDCKCTFLSKATEENRGHGLTNWAIKDLFGIGIHAKGKGEING